MASSAKAVLLGYVDDYMSSNTESVFTNKVGGDPDWPPHLPHHDKPQCGECGQHLVLVTQIHAPLSQHQRTLFLFSCLQPACWGKQRSWCCLRCHIVEEDKVEENDEVETTAVGGVDDWGVDDAEDWGEDDLTEINGGINVENIAKVESAAPVMSLKKLSLKDGDKPTKQEERHDEHVDQAEALIETGDNGEVVMDDLPESVMNSDNNIPQLFSVNQRKITADMRISPFYIWVEEEKMPEEEVMTDKELMMINEYKAREAVESVQNKSSSSGHDQYERSVPSHGDQYFHKFLNIISLNPGQILRYCRGSGVGPLLLSPLTLDTSMCDHCGAGTEFEFQLLPSLVSQLSVPGLEDGAALEFGTVLVFTCSQSCWSRDSGPRSETVIVQMESM